MYCYLMPWKTAELKQNDVIAGNSLTISLENGAGKNTAQGKLPKGNQGSLAFCRVIFQRCLREKMPL